MNLIPINRDIDILDECGYGTPIEYDNPSFHGHQKGVAICLINKETGVVEDNMLRSSIPEARRNDLLKMILESKTIIKVVDDITQMHDGKLVKKQIFYLPYIVGGHSVYQPTVNYDNVSGATNVSYKLDIEILFVHENLNRYITVQMNTRNVSLMDGVYCLFDDEEELQKELALHGIKYQEEPDEEGLQGYIVDFYDEAGNPYMYGFEGPWGGERLRDTIASVRLIGIQMEVDKDDESEGDVQNP